MRRTPTIEDIQRLTRAQVCSRCPQRTRGDDARGVDFARPCESKCGLFIHLPVLREAARQLDPLVGHRRRVLEKMVGEISTRRRGAKGVRRNGMLVVNLLEELFA